MNEQDLKKLKEIAQKEGMPYQAQDLFFINRRLPRENIGERFAT